MNCRTCGYALWNLDSRACPECAAPFLPSQFQFRRHSVAFCCPACNQPYYGTSEGGHLEPRAFTCVTCGRHTHEDEMVLRPTQGVVEKGTRFRTVPWLDREIRSIVSRFFQTTVWAVFLPAQLGSRLPSPERPWAAAGFAAAWVALLLLPAFVLSVLAGAFIAPAALVVGVVLGAAIWALVMLPLWALVTHLCLIASGPCRGPFSRTLACHAYTIPVCFPLAIPVLGLYASPLIIIAWGVLIALTLRTGQAVSSLRAFVCTAVFPLLVALIAAMVMFLVVLPWYRNTLASVQQSMAPVSTPSQQATTISQALFAAARNSGGPPTHASELLIAGSIKSTDLLSGQKYRSDARASIANQHLMLFDFGYAPQAMTAAVRAFVKATTPQGSVTAHRLGDVVFTYHGINLNAPADAGLWLFVITTEPPRQFPAITLPPVSVSSASPPARPALAVARADGTVIEIPDADFAAALQAQNTLRAARGLPASPTRARSSPTASRPRRMRRHKSPKRKRGATATTVDPALRTNGCTRGRALALGLLPRSRLSSRTPPSAGTCTPGSGRRRGYPLAPPPARTCAPSPTRAGTRPADAGTAGPRCRP